VIPLRLAELNEALGGALTLPHRVSADTFVSGSVQTNSNLTRWSQVTHYFFDDCVYYTPAFSDEYLGRLALRNLVSIADGAPKPNLYLGEEILPPPTLRPATPLLARWGRRIARALKQRVPKNNSGAMQ